MPFFEVIAIKSLKTKILLVFIFILVIPLALLMYSAVHRASLAAQYDFNRRLSYAAQLFRENLEEQLDLMKIRAKTIADFDFLTAATAGFPASMTEPLMEYEVIRSGLDYMAIVSGRTHRIAEEGNPPSDMLPKIIPAICHSPLNANIYIIETEPWVFASAEITKLKHEEKYHIVFAFRLSRDFADRIKSLTGAEFSIIYAGKRILTTLMDVYGKRMIGTPPQDPDAKEGNLDVLGETHYFVRDQALRGQLSEAIILEISLPASEFTVLGSKIANDFIFMGALSILLALITGTILSLHLAEPLKQLAQTTSRVADGDYDIEIQSPRQDEIGLLTGNFKAMLVSLKQERDLKMSRMKELQTLFQISNAVNFITDSEELLKFVLTDSIDLLEAERGSIMLLDDQTDELVVKVAYGGRYRLVTSTPIKLGQGICGMVGKEGKGRICNTGFKDADFKNFGSLLSPEDVKTLLCSPLKFKDGIIGVINIVNKRDGVHFEENDLSLLNVIASQAAITIENNKLYELSITDGLTKLFVHRYFQARLAEELLRARRYGLKLSLIMIDIDNFKNFNDIYGHQVGDQVLQKVATAIRDTIRTGIDIPCRYGGEEMSIILPETRSDEAFSTAERLRESIAAISISHSMGELRITCSLGVASYPGDAHDRESLIAIADRAMYVSKHAGKNRTTQASTIV